MRLNERQRIFTKNIGLLIAHAYAIGIELTFGEAHRTWSQVLLYYFGYRVERSGQNLRLIKTKRKSKTLRSRHPDRLAVDFNFFINGKLTYDFDDIKPLGDFWESLHPENRWGGDFDGNDKEDGFVDTPHFEMKR